ncbi:MAG: tetratricopeptide repeat protein [Solobacterium sp.]|nr:tetratricopeptide repeat protein [Solobacterium sp.]
MDAVRRILITILTVALFGFGLRFYYTNYYFPDLLRRQAEEYIAVKDYAGAIRVLEQIGDGERISDLLYKEAEELLEKGNFEAAQAVIERLGDSRDTAGLRTEVIYQRGMSFYRNSQYEAASAVFETVRDYRNSEEMILDCAYQLAVREVLNRNYKTASDLLSDPKFADYKDTKTLYPYVSYMAASEAFEKGDYETAVTCFERAGKDYQDGSDMIRRSQYKYVQKYRNNYDGKGPSSDTYFRYISELKSAGYLDSAEIFDEVYALSATVCVNAEERNRTDNYEILSREQEIWFHVQLNGGAKNTSYAMTYMLVQPDGKYLEGSWKSKWRANGSGTVRWKYNDSRGAATGDLILYVYADGRLLTEHKVYIGR